MDSDQPKRAEVVKAQPAPVVAPQEGTGGPHLLSEIAKVISNPDLDVDKMGKLLEMHQRIEADARKTAFQQALAKLQAVIPQIDKQGTIYNKDRKTVRSRYAKIEHIDQHVRPLMAEHGFAISFNFEERPNEKYLITAELTHAAGHSKTLSVILPIDRNDYRSAVQNVNSTISVGRRTLLKMHLNIIERDEDQDGTSGQTTSTKVISADQAADIELAVAEMTALKRSRFYKYLKVNKAAEILADDLKKAADALELHRQNEQQKG